MLELSLFKVLEWLAVIASLFYIVLAVKENLWCWVAAAISTILYIAIFWRANLLMDSLLNSYYLVMAGYGYYSWTHPKQASKDQLAISRFTIFQHVFTIAGIFIGAYICGALISRFTSAAWPYVDSFTTVASFVATWMVTRKIVETWLYWIVIDLICIFVYIERGLHPTAGLFAIYTAMAVYGFIRWRKLYSHRKV